MDESKLPPLGSNVRIKPKRPYILLGYSLAMNCALLADSGMTGGGHGFSTSDNVWSEDRWIFWSGIYDFLKKGWPGHEKEQWGLRFVTLNLISED